MTNAPSDKLQFVKREQLQASRVKCMLYMSYWSGHNFFCTREFLYTCSIQLYVWKCSWKVQIAPTGSTCAHAPPWPPSHMTLSPFCSDVCFVFWFLYTGTNKQASSLLFFEDKAEATSNQMQTSHLSSQLTHTGLTIQAPSPVSHGVNTPTHIHSSSLRG